MNDPLFTICQGRQCMLADRCRRHQQWSIVSSGTYHEEGQFYTIANCDPETRELYTEN